MFRFCGVVQVSLGIFTTKEGSGIEYVVAEETKAVDFTCIRVLAIARVCISPSPCEEASLVRFRLNTFLLFSAAKVGQFSISILVYHNILRL